MHQLHDVVTHLTDIAGETSLDPRYRERDRKVKLDIFHMVMDVPAVPYPTPVRSIATFI